jgi:NAD-dependent dihydropyrimidine dehydrogenase PreA subunit
VINNIALIVLALGLVHSASDAADATNATIGALTPAKHITIRTEIYSRPPYYGATYYFYEKNGQLIWTKLEVCKKFGECTIACKNGKHIEQEDTSPVEKNPAFIIPHEKYGKHRCLTRFGLLK